MSPRKRVFLLISIMALVAIIVETVAISLLYKTAFIENRTRLEESAKSQARLIEAIARFDKKYSNDYPQGAREATLSQIVDGHKQYKGFGETGELLFPGKKGIKSFFC